MECIAGFIAGTLVFGSCLWFGMRLTGERGSFLALLVIAAVASLVGFVPYAGWALSSIVTLVLICKWTSAELWPDAVLMVLVANGVAYLAVAAIIGLVGGP